MRSSKDPVVELKSRIARTTRLRDDLRYLVALANTGLTVEDALPGNRRRRLRRLERLLPPKPHYDAIKAWHARLEGGIKNMKETLRDIRSAPKPD